MNPTSLLKYLWASPCSAVGLALAALPCLLGASGRVLGGVLEVAFTDSNHVLARWLLKLPYAGITFGHVVLAPTHQLQDELRAHERAHVAQYETWGPVFLIAYPLSSLVQVLRGRRGHADNHFEIQARATQCVWASASSWNAAAGSAQAPATDAEARGPGAIDAEDRAPHPV
jgi:hypothetical protein